MDRTIFLDRDGTINDDLNGFVHKTEDFKLLPGVLKGLKILSKEFVFIIITNQSGIGRGFFTTKDMIKFNKKLINELKKENIIIIKIYFCPHKPADNCDCRKPSTRFIEEAEMEFKIDLNNSWVIGDHPSDIEMGTKAGCRNIYLLTGHGKKHYDDLKNDGVQPNYVAENFLQGAEYIIKNT